MIVYRLSRGKYADSLSGKGAALNGGRWNSKGIEIIYTSESRALALAEILTHISLSMLPSDYFIVSINIPDSLRIETINLNNLPIGWNNYPHMEDAKIIGDSFIRNNKSCVLKVPSAVVFGDFNLLINPFHTGFGKLKIIDKSLFPIDSRLF